MTAPPLPAEIRNPWTGISMWREFKWDMAHPRAMARRSWLGMKGQNPLVPAGMRFFGFACLAVGAMHLVTGLVLVILL